MDILQSIGFLFWIIVALLSGATLVIFFFTFKVPEGKAAIRGMRVYNSGWNFGSRSGARLVDVTRRTLHIEPCEVLLLDRSKVEVTVTVGWTPDVRNLPSYFRIGESAGIEAAIASDVLSRLEKWGVSRDHPLTLTKALESHDQLQKELMEELTGVSGLALVPTTALQGLEKLSYPSSELGVEINRVNVRIKPLAPGETLRRMLADDDPDIRSRIYTMIQKTTDRDQLERTRRRLIQEFPEQEDDINDDAEQQRIRLKERP